MQIKLNSKWNVTESKYKNRSKNKKYINEIHTFLYADQENMSINKNDQF